MREKFSFFANLFVAYFSFRFLFRIIYINITVNNSGYMKKIHAEENCQRKKIICDKLWAQDQTARCEKLFAQYANLKIM